MLIKNASTLITNTTMREMQDHTVYCSVGLLSLDNGQKFDISVREKEVYEKLKPMTKLDADLELTNTKYGIKLNLKNIIKLGAAI